MVFGVDFGFALRQSMNSTLPHVLKYCFEAIEARGIKFVVNLITSYRTGQGRDL